MRRYIRILHAVRRKAAGTAAAILAAAFICAMALPVAGFAARGTVDFEDGRGKASVSLTLDGDDGAKKGATSLELGLMLTSPQLAALSVSFVFEESVSGGRVAEFRYHEDTGLLNLYVAGETPLFAEDTGSLTVGNVVVDGGTASINVVENSLKLSGNGILVKDVFIRPLESDVLITDGAGEEPEAVDRSRLRAILEKASEYQEADYTPESYGILAEAVKTAEAVLNKADVTQEEIDEAVLLVENAIGSLVEKQTVIGDNRPSPGGNDSSLGENRPSSGGTQNGAGTGSPSKTADGTDTGDKTQVLPYVLTAVLSVAVLGGIAFLQRRRSGKKRRSEK